MGQRAPAKNCRDVPWHVRDRTTLLNGLHRPVHGMYSYPITR